MVTSLKTNGMPRSHPCFKKAYVKLFDLSKLFLKVSSRKEHTINPEMFANVCDLPLLTTRAAFRGGKGALAPPASYTFAPLQLGKSPVCPPSPHHGSPLSVKEKACTYVHVCMALPKNFEGVMVVAGR